MKAKKPKLPHVVLYSEDAWRNGPLSIAAHYGAMKINGRIYEIVNAKGETLRQISARMERRHQEGLAIPPGEPADLVLKTWVPVYKKLGRDRIIALLGQGASLKEARLMAKNLNPVKNNKNINNLKVLNNSKDFTQKQQQ